MSAISSDTQVATLVLEQPGRTRVFEQLGIDYCCGGKKPLAAACAERGLDVTAVISALEGLREDEPGESDWTAATVAELCAHIVDHHHGYLREELPPLRQLVDKVAGRHGGGHPELVEIQETFHTLADELEQHMVKEERILFPACVALEAGTAADFPFGSVENPIRMMLDDHDEVAAGLQQLRALTNAYAPPSGGCNSYRALFDRLHTLETDTHRHIHEENNILFPRAVALESAR